jgi:response regulator RpfG family c-di-GMP phosphodiesterase
MSQTRQEANGGGTVLVVDDNEGALRLAERALGRFGHQVDTAASVPEALERLERTRYDVVITDLRMPGASGLDLLGELRERWPETRAILMSAHAAPADAALAIEHGIDRLLLKPFRLDELRAGVEKALAERRARAELAERREIVEAALRQRQTESKLWVLRAAHALVAAVEAKDAYTAGHATRVTAYAMAIAEVIGGIDPERFRLAGDLHDVGKIGVPDAVLNKPERLSAEEFALVKRHPEAGERILRAFIDDRLVLEVVRSHHERWDGRGYPDGLAGEVIPLPARILAAADTLDAMTSNRAYRKGLAWEVAVEEIRRCAGTQFDPAVVGAFSEALPTLEALYVSLEGAGRSGAAPPLG